MWSVQYARDRDGCTGSLPTLACACALPWGRAIKLFNYCVVIKIMEISDLEVYDWLELLRFGDFSHDERPSGGRFGRTELDERASVERTELRRSGGG